MRPVERRPRSRPAPVLASVAFAVVVALGCIAAVGGAATVVAPTSGIDLRLDFETGDTSQFSGLECPDPETQVEVYGAGAAYPSPRQGRYAARFSETARDIWAGNGMVRCLAARYDTDESAGDEYYYAFSLSVPASGLNDNLLWELHHPSSLYRLPGCGVAPLALSARSGGLRFRIATGNCTVGAGYSYWNPDIPIPGLATVPRSTWIDFVVHVSFSESDGIVEVWHRTGSGTFPATPQLARHGIPTLPYSNTANVHGVSLYTEMGLYTGRTDYSGSDTVYLDGYRRGTSRAAVLAEFPNGAPTPTASPAVAVPSAPIGGRVGVVAAPASSPLTASPPTIAQSIQGGQTLRGTVTWTAVPSSRVKQVVFAMDDNKATNADGSPPYSLSLDTTRFANGAHTVGLTVTLLDGTVVWRPYQLGIVTIDNSVSQEGTGPDSARVEHPPLQGPQQRGQRSDEQLPDRERHGGRHDRAARNVRRG